MSELLPAERPATTTLADFDNVPLFMQSLPEKDDGSNDALEALRSLVYEDSPEGDYRFYSCHNKLMADGKKRR
jgi:hypothetical protein